MANRLFNQFSFGLEKGRVVLYADITIGAAGAPTLVAGKNKGIKSIVRNSAGDYTLTFQDTYQRVLNFDFSFKAAAAPASPLIAIKAEAVGTIAAPTIEFVCYSGTTATDPASGEELRLEIKLSNSTAL